jgi:hypothetical protein
MRDIDDIAGALRRSLREHVPQLALSEGERAWFCAQWAEPFADVATRRRDTTTTADWAGAADELAAASGGAEAPKLKHCPAVWVSNRVWASLPVVVTRWSATKVTVHGRPWDQRCEALVGAHLRAICPAAATAFRGHLEQAVLL